MADETVLDLARALDDELGNTPRGPEPVVAPVQRHPGEIIDEWAKGPKTLGFLDAMKELVGRPSKAVPFLGSGSEAWEMAEVYAAAKRLEGGSATTDDVGLIYEFLDQAKHEQGWGYLVGSILTELPAFAGEIALTGGVYTAGRKLGAKAGRRAVGVALRKAVEASLMRSGARKAMRAGGAVLGTALGAAAQTAAIPTRVVAETYRAALPELSLSEDDAGRMAIVLEATDEDFLSALPTGFKRAWIELVSERTGAALSGIPPAPLVRELQGKLVARLVGENATKKRLNELLVRVGRAGGWNGVLEEFGEERVGDVLRAILDDQPWADVIPSWKQATAELAAFAVPGAARAAAVAAAGRDGGEAHTSGPRERPDAAARVQDEGGAATPPPADAATGETVAAPPRSVDPGARARRAEIPEDEAAALERHGDAYAVEPTTAEDLWAQEFLAQRGQRLVLAERPDGRRMEAPASQVGDIVVLDANQAPGTATRSLVFHEVAHVVERVDPGAWAAFKEVLEGSYPQVAARAKALYEGDLGAPLTAELEGPETVARTVEELAGLIDLLYNDPGAVAEALEAEPTFFVRLLQAIRRVLSSLGLPLDARTQQERAWEEIQALIGGQLASGLGPKEGLRLARAAVTMLDAALQGAKVTPGAQKGDSPAQSVPRGTSGSAATEPGKTVVEGPRGTTTIETDDPELAAKLAEKLAPGRGEDVDSGPREGRARGTGGASEASGDSKPATGSAPESTVGEEPTPPQPHALARELIMESVRRVREGGTRPTITGARSRFKALNGGQAFEGDSKAFEELLEAQAVDLARGIVRAAGSVGAAFDELVLLHEALPRLSARTSSSVERQAYSTPLPLAYVASRLGGVAGAGSVLEPSAGHGALLIEADPASTVAVELDPARAAVLREQGFDVVEGDFLEASPPSAEVVIGNPPFGRKLRFDGSRKGGTGTRSQTWSVQVGTESYKTSQIDHAIAARALRAMSGGGRAVLIVASAKPGTDAERKKRYGTGMALKFWRGLYRGFNVVDHFTVAGDLYATQGAKWPVDVVVIEGRGRSKRRLPGAEAPRVLGSWSEIRGLLNASHDTGLGTERDEPPTDGGRLPRHTEAGDVHGLAAGAQAPSAGNDRGPAVSGDPGAPGRPGEGEPADPRDGGRAGAPDGVPPGGDGGRGRGGVPERARGGRQAAAEVAGEDADQGRGEREARDGDEPGGVAQGGGPGEAQAGGVDDAAIAAAIEAELAELEGDAAAEDPAGEEGYDDPFHLATHRQDVLSQVDKVLDRAISSAARDELELASEAHSEALHELDQAADDIDPLLLAGLRGDERRARLDFMAAAGHAWRDELEDDPRLQRVWDLFQEKRRQGKSLTDAQVRRIMAPKKRKAKKKAAPKKQTETPGWADELDQLFAVRKPSEPVDEELYQKAKPAFAKAVEETGADPADPVGLARTITRYMVEAFGWTVDRVRRLTAYLVHYAQEVAARPQEGLDTGENELQVPYQPSSKARSVGTRQPRFMRDAAVAALERLTAEHGPVDAFVAKKLGYKKADLPGYFSAEQIDALALAINEVDHGAAFIVGDQTGIGKGRVVAGMMRYAMSQGLVPVFMTKSPGLYADMLGDFADIGMPEVRPLLTNNDLSGAKGIPLADVKGREGEVLTSLPPSRQRLTFKKAIETGELPIGFEAVFTTYSQQQSVKGKRGQRHDLMQAIAPNAFFVLDESHLAGGSGEQRGPKDKAPSSAEFIRELLGQARSVAFSSATYAKNPTVMTLYARTDMMLSVDTPEELVQAMETGGVPLLQVVGRMLAEAGQYIRREKSYDGIEFDFPTVPADQGAIDQVAGLLAELFELDLRMDEVRKSEGLVQMLREEGDEAAMDVGVGEEAAEAAGFASIMHNLIGQVIVAAKIPSAIEEAVAKVRERSEGAPEGRKVVIAVARTGGSLLKGWVEQQEDIAVGSAVEDYTFGEALVRYLERTREVPIKDRPVRLELSDKLIVRLGGERLLADYNALRTKIRNTDFRGLSPSPIDALRDGLAAAGLAEDEITGRQYTVRHDTDLDKPVLGHRKSTEAAKKAAMRSFNAGELDVLVINQSGSTGYSMHASEKFEDQKPRHMIVLEPEANIDTFMQILGRINRTGQVVLPSFSIPLSTIPAERRVGAVLKGKLANLNATTTANDEGAVSLDAVPNMLNEYGDEVANEVLLDDLALARALDVDKNLGEPGEAPAGLMRRVTGRAMLLSFADQEELFARLETSYAAHVATLDAMGENKLRARAMDLQAETLQKDIIREGEPGSESPFAAPTFLEDVRVRRTSKPLTPEAVHDLVEESDAASMIAGLEAAATEQAEEAAKAARELRESLAEGMKAEGRKKLKRSEERRVAAADRAYKRPGDALKTAKRLIGLLQPGAHIKITREVSEDGDLATEFAMVTSLQPTGRAKNPLALSGYEATIYTSEQAAPIRLPLSKLSGKTQVHPASQEDVHAAFAAGGEGTETRQVITGNLLSAWSMLGKKGQMVMFTTADGRTRQGVLLRRSVDARKALEERPVELDPVRAMTFLAKAPEGTPLTVKLEGGVGRATLQKKGRDIEILVPTRGGKPFYLNPEARKVAGDFVQKRGGGPYRLLAKGSAAEGIARRILQAWTSTLGAKILAEESRDVAREITGQKFAMRRQRQQPQEEETEPLFDSDWYLRESLPDRLLRRFQDRFLRVRRLREQMREAGYAVPEDQDPYLGADTEFQGKVEERFKKLEKRFVVPVRELLGRAGISLEDAHLYLYALHAERRNQVIMDRNPDDGFGQEQKPGSGMRLSRALEIIETAHAKDEAAYRELARLVHQMNAEALQARVDYGLVSDDQADQWRTTWGPTYVPLRTDSKPSGFTMRKGKGFDVRNPESKRAKGRASLADNVLAFSFEQAEEAIVRGEKNSVGQKLLRLVKANPDPSFWLIRKAKVRVVQEEDGVHREQPHELSEEEWKHTFSVKVEGKEVHIRFKDPLLPRALKQLDIPEMGAVLRALAGAMRWLARMSTSLNPDFILPNLVRDLQTAAVHLAGRADGKKLAAQVGKDVMGGGAIRAMWRAVRDQEDETEWKGWGQRYLDAGGKVGFYHSPSLQERLGLWQRAIDDLDPSNPRKVWLTMRKGLEFVDDINVAIENGARLAAFRRLVEAGMSEARAAEVAKDLTVNFNRRGEWGTVMNALWLFFNAGVQGTARMMRALASSRTVRRIGYGLVAASVLIDILNRIGGGEDDDEVPYYDKIPDYVKTRNLVVMLPGTGGRHIRIPLPYGYSVFHTLGSSIAQALPREVGGADASLTSRAGIVAGALAESFSPIGSEASLVQWISPTITDPVVQIAENRTFFGSPIMPEQRGWGPPDPDSQRYWSTVSPPARWITSALNKLTGGDEVQPGLADVSPESLEHLAGFVAGGSGRTAKRLFVDLPGKILSEEAPVELNDVPIVRRFLGEVPHYYTRTRFYENLTEIERLESRVRLYTDKGEHDRAQEIAREAGGLYALRKRASRVRRQVSVAPSERKDALMEGFNLQVSRAR